MQSPLEREPSLIAGIGLITVRWALLESLLADALGSVMQSLDGDGPYYAVGAFSQRLAMVRGALRGSILEPLHREIADSLLDRIASLWKSRNYLIHSHYVYREWVPDRARPQKPIRRAFCYEHRGLGGEVTFVPVKKGTFLNHANQVSKRARQLQRLGLAIQLGYVPLIPTTAAPSRRKSRKPVPLSPHTLRALPAGE